MATQPSSSLYDDMIRYRKQRDQDIAKRVIAAPGLAIAGAAGQPGAADYLLPKYDDPRQWELTKLELKQKLMEQARKAEQMRMRGLSDLNRSAKDRDDLILGILESTMKAAGADMNAIQRIRDSYNDNVTSLRRTRIAGLMRTQGGGASGGAMRSFIDKMADDVAASANPDQTIIDQTLLELDAQRAFAAGLDPQKGPATAVEDLYAIDAYYADKGGLDAIIARNPDHPGVQELAQAWADAQAEGGSSAFVGSLRAEAQAAEQEAVKGLYDTVPASMQAGIDAGLALIQQLGISTESAISSVDSVMDKLAPQSKQDMDYGKLKDSLDQVDQLSPELAPGTMKWNIINGDKFQQWKKQNGFQTDEVAWRELRRQAALKHSEAMSADRRLARDRAFGRVDADSGPPQEALAAAQAAHRADVLGQEQAPPMDAPSAVTADAGAPQFFLDPNADQVWMMDETKGEFRPLTMTEYDQISPYVDAGIINNDPASFAEAKQKYAALTSQKQQQSAAGQTLRAEAAQNLQQAAANTDPQSSSPVPGFHDAAAKAGFAVTHPSYAIQRALGKGRLKKEALTAGLFSQPLPASLEEDDPYAEYLRRLEEEYRKTAEASP